MYRFPSEDFPNAGGSSNGKQNEADAIHAVQAAFR